MRTSIDRSKSAAMKRFIMKLATVCFAAYSGECIAQTSRADQALELLRTALACVPSVDDGGHSGISTGYSKTDFQGNNNAFTLTTVDTMVLGSVTNSYSARFQDLDGSQTILVGNSSLGLGCRNNASCIQIQRSVRCNSGFDCVNQISSGARHQPWCSKAFLLRIFIFAIGKLLSTHSWR